MELFDAHSGALMSMLRRLCGRRCEAEDVFQETAIRVWRSFDRRPVLRSPKSRLFTIGYRTFLVLAAQTRSGPELPDLEDSRGVPPLEGAERAESWRLVQDAMSDLPEIIRQVVVLHYLGGLSIRETAAAMNLSEGTVKSRLNSALCRFRSVRS